MTSGRGCRSALAAAVLASAAALAGCSSASGAVGESDSLLEVPLASHVTVTTKVVGSLGRIVVDGHGHALYIFPPDAGSRVSCLGACAGVWPPLDIANGQKPTPGPGVNPADLSTISDPNTGARVVTYLGYPLYHYSGDVRAGVANGQNLFNNGGPWYVLNPNGFPITTGGDASS